MGFISFLALKTPDRLGIKAESAPQLVLRKSPLWVEGEVSPGFLLLEMPSLKIKPDVSCLFWAQTPHTSPLHVGLPCDF